MGHPHTADERRFAKDHARRVASFPEDVREAHEHSSDRRAELLASAKCGCFYCCESYRPSAIQERVDERQTALCPRCGIDSVIGDKSGYPTSRSFLARMRRYWFAGL